MGEQIPLILSDDARAIVLRVQRTYANSKLDLHELQTCWRPPGGRSKARPWTDRRMFAAINEAETAGAIRRVAGCCGTVLEIA